MTDRMPAVGDTVQCPEDRGTPAYTGTVTYVGPSININIHGVRYVWCVVRDYNGNCHQWPSHRLGYKLPE